MQKEAVARKRKHSVLVAVPAEGPAWTSSGNDCRFGGRALLGRESIRPKATSMGCASVQHTERSSHAETPPQANESAMPAFGMICETAEGSCAFIRSLRRKGRRSTPPATALIHNQSIPWLIRLDQEPRLEALSGRDRRLHSWCFRQFEQVFPFTKSVIRQAKTLEASTATTKQQSQNAIGIGNQRKPCPQTWSFRLL